MTEIIFASHNHNKAAEINKILAPDITVHTLDEMGITEDIEETADNLVGNALIKARYVYAKTGKDCFADDTGLEVDALNGAPGVHSARYAGEECDSQKNMNKLLAELHGNPSRKARFRTVIAYIKDGKEYLFEGIVDGSIATAQSGNGGFGYDPIFVPDEGAGLTFAEMSLEQKNKISHRARAIAKFVTFVKNN